MKPGVSITERLRAEIEGSARIPGFSEYHVVGAGIRTLTGEVLCGVDGDSHVHLLMPVPAASKLVEDRRSEGVQVVRHELMEGGERQVYVDLVCSKPHLRRTFDLLAEEVLEGLKSSSGPPDQLAVASIGRWRELLDRAPRPPLGRERLAGLFGELTVLLELAARTPVALDLWSGPRGQRHDFTGSACSVEVKVTMSALRRVGVSSLDQLLAPEGAQLVLRFLRVEEASGATSVPDLVEKLVTMRFDRPELLRLLGEVDYDIAHEAEYRRHGFRIVDRRAYRIAEGFPRITVGDFVEGKLPDGIEAVSYNVNLEFASRFEIPPTEWDSVVQELAAGL
jgi:hypothetical protein